MDLLNFHVANSHKVFVYVMETTGHRLKLHLFQIDFLGVLPLHYVTCVITYMVVFFSSLSLSQD